MEKCMLISDLKEMQFLLTRDFAHTFLTKNQNLFYTKFFLGAPNSYLLFGLSGARDFSRGQYKTDGCTHASQMVIAKSTKHRETVASIADSRSV
jgi:hypothetical protein